LEEPGVIDTKSDQTNENQQHIWLTNVYLSN